MAEQTVLNVSLKDYKKKIDELRGSLLGLTKDSQEYANTAKEIKDMQDKLNEVMSVGKKDLDGVDGSYNSLVKTMAALKKEWRTMEIGTEEWKNLGMQIDDINNKLKDADASVGVFSRNVGDYQNAFGKAFETAIQGLGKGGGILSGTANQVKQLIPLVKSVNQTATAGLNGVKKALASTGIGALIVGVGLLIANFDKLQKLFKKDNPVEEATKGFEDLKKAIDAANQSLELDTELMEANGATTEQIRLKKIELIKAQMAETQAQLDNVRATIKQIEAHSAFRRWITGEKNDLEDLRELESQLFEQETRQSNQITQLLNSNTADSLKKKKDAIDEEKKKLDELLKKVEENSKSELEKLRDKYEKEKKLMEKYHKDTTELTRQYNNAVDKIVNDGIISSLRELGNTDFSANLDAEFQVLTDRMKKFQEFVDGKFPPDGIIKTEQVTDEMLEKAKEMGVNSKDEFANLYNAAYNNYLNFLRSLQRTDTIFNVATQNVRGYFSELSNDSSKFLREYDDIEVKLTQTPENTKEWYVLQTQKLNAFLSHIKEYKKELLQEIDNPELDEYGIQVIQYKLKGVDILIAEYQKKINEVNDQNRLLIQEWAQTLNESVNQDKTVNQSLLGNTTRFYKVWQERIKAAEWYRDNLFKLQNETNAEYLQRQMEADNQVIEAKRQFAKETVSVQQQINAGLISVWANLNSAYEQHLKAQGETDKEAFEATKGSKIAQATVNTIEGALAAFMGYQELPQPYGVIIGAIQAAAVAAAGWAEIEQIKATKFNSEGQNITNPMPTVNVTPRQADYSPETVTNLTGASEVDNLKNAVEGANIWVSVTDINNAQAKVTQRNKEASF